MTIPGTDVGLWAFRLGTRTPCCERIGQAMPNHRVLCRGCGSVYRDVAHDLRVAFPGCVDVTPMTPRRFLVRVTMIDYDTEVATDA